MYSSESSLITPSRSIMTSLAGRSVTPSRSESIAEVRLEFGKADAYLLARIALADGHGPRRQSVPVDGDTKRRARLVLATIAPTDRTLLVVIDVEMLLQRAIDRQGL